MNQKELENLFQKTNFARNPVTWDNLSFDEEGCPHVSQCSYLGNILINLGDTYEQSGYDCLFIQELLKLYQEGCLKVQ